ncbi:Bug family tripartite tricarboxylate transporter substrate binding protein [Allopusillimonas ginsengisoli]|uniref:Bug family tripartite tricarboxylate transporter substrate binding protein n=1 Tax=Allopusillimonas ginsengisoli TaxID=453575 RepID=UPI00101F95E4|nr:tripartite tricarboxylate transporter substrate binding protein [Allopusillimonas ginsengisoli]TEA69501.1 tripartite tricarboxylate transporter substrate binding protein [Allopusillimonas ginsengisoli]
MFKSILTLTLLLFSSATLAAASGTSGKPIRIVAPFAAGGSVDIVARTIAEPLAKRLGQPVVVENKSGASGMIGARQVANAAPDGSTLLANSSIHVIVPSLYPDITYDALNDLIPVSQITLVPLVLVAAPSLPVNSVEDLVTWGKQQKDGVSYASAGNGSTPHLAGEMLGEATGMSMTHVPYKGSGAAMIDVMGGQVPIMFDALTAVMGQIKTGSLKPLAVASTTRSPLLPDVPTFEELGYSQMDLNTWHGIWAPKGTSPEIVNKLSETIRDITHLPEVAERISSLGGIPVGNTPEEFDAFNRAEFEKWGAMIKRFNVKLE